MRKTILCVDDELYWIKTLRAWLGDLYEVVGMEDARVALLRIEQTEIALVITDLEMGGMNGAEFSGRIKERWPRLPVILWTGHPDPPFSRADLTLDKSATLNAGPERLRGIVAQLLMSS
ncbi:response regulator [Candidatus Uhrbacteria bacterium]|nr:response regulator [Candidatus Uhrbacteria bacterium]